jgi:isopenicillin-N epimerase
MQSPLLGTAVRHEWMLDPDFVTVNHGSFGAAPRVVLAVQEDWQRRMEVQPTQFMHAVLPGALRAAADRLAAFMGGEGKDLAFLENATVGCNAVLRSRPLKPGDEVVVLTHGYGAVRNTVRYVTELAGARMTQAAVPFPNPDADGVIAALEAAITPRTRLAVLDHITSPSALVLPLDRMVAACHAHDVPVLVDGAHGPGQVGLDLPAIGADWYVGNCHKWLCAPKGSAFIWARPDRQDGLHPVTISHGYEKGFLEEFDWTGTRDFSAFLAVPAAIDFHARLGGEALRARNAALAAEATALLARRLNSEIGATGPLAGAMGVVRLPIAGEATAEHAKTLRARLLDEKTDAPLHAMAGGIWLRLSAHAYNELADYERLAEIAARILRQAE